MTDSEPYSVPRPPGKWRAIALAAFVHAVLFAFLWFGVNWQSETPLSVEAEVWSPQNKDAAPKPQEVQQPEPPPVKAEPIVKAPKEVKETPVVPDPEIVLEREKKRQQQLKREQLEEAAREKKAEESRKEKTMQAQKVAQQQADEKRKAQLEAETLSKQKAALEQKKLASEKLRKQDAVETKKLNDLRDAEMRRIAGSENAATGSGGTGTAAKSQGSRGDASYIQKVGAKIKSNTIFNGADEVSNNPAVEYVVDLLPDGSIRGTPRKSKESGIPGFDDAVLRAIEKSQPFPADKSGLPPSRFTVSHRPKDQ